METIFKQITREEYEKLKIEILNRFNFVSVRRNTQAYALGGFDINPKDYENGFTKEQINLICVYLREENLDNSSLDVSRAEVYGEGQGEFTGTPKAHLLFRDGFRFLMRWDNE